jgi:branched-chain amino acid aminotransferase
VWLNGRLTPSDEPHLSVYDRGFQLGDGVFEALRARRGVPIELAGHMARLHRSLDAMGFELGFGDDAIATGISELLAAEGWDGLEPPGDAAVRITVSRGYNPNRNVLAGAGGSATVAIQAWPFTGPTAGVLEEGERVISSVIRRDPSSPIAGIKSTSRAELVYARLEAERAGADDAIFLAPDGRVEEATTSNVLMIRDDVCATPRLGTGLLAGTTRAWLVEHAGLVGLRAVEEDIHLDELADADEVALCASIGGVLPVVVVDGRRIGNGKPGPRTLALREARERWIDDLSIEGSRSRA